MQCSVPAKSLTADENCSCKGIRTCLVCEGKQKKGNNSGEKEVSVLYYNRETEHAEIRNEEGEGGGNFSDFEFPGVTIINDFISPSEENHLISSIESSPWKPSQSGRNKQDFGPKVNFKKKKLKLASFKGLPSYSKELVERMRAHPGLGDFEPVELCNLEYTPERGSSIDPHFDDNWLWGERLITLNLISDSWLNMTWGGSQEDFENVVNLNIDQDDVSVKIPLGSRSLVVLYGPARHQWQHSILRSDIKNRRICCTFRELSKEFLTGARKNEGREYLNIASSFSGSVVL